MGRNFKFDKTAIKVFKIGEEPEDYLFWLEKTPEERLSAIEFLRKQMHSENDSESRLQRVYRVVELSQS